MKFSILVPVYNVEKYLEQCVESLLNQTFNEAYEIILVDDGSTDSSGTICDKYQKSNPDKVRVVHKKNEGHTSARLEAIKNATGEYCLFCDSDDFVELNLLETVNNVIVDNPETDMVMYSFSYYENEKKRARNIHISEAEEVFEGSDKKKLYNLLITTPYLNSLWTKAIKTEIVKYDPTDYSKIADKDIAEDAYISIYLVSECKKIVGINKSLYNYRIIPESISRSCNITKLPRKNTLYVYNRFLEYLAKWDMNDETHIQKLNARWLNEVIYTFRQYYENSDGVKERKAVLNYNWGSMLPDAVKNNSPNPYENKTNRKLFERINTKKYLRIRLHFIYEKAYKNYRRLKARLLKNG